VIFVTLWLRGLLHFLFLSPLIYHVIPRPEITDEQQKYP
jgi:hypothetical protein